MGYMEKTKFFHRIDCYKYINDLADKVLSLTDEDWDKFTYRQKMIVGHGDTRTIPLLFDFKKKHRQIKHRHFDLYSDHLESISAVLDENEYPANIQRANLVKLLPNSQIAPHIDKGEFLLSTHRIHLPIKTNQQCRFIVGGIQEHIPFGELWEINNTGEMHSVHNDGDEDRIHLIIDVNF